MGQRVSYFVDDLFACKYFGKCKYQYYTADTHHLENRLYYVRCGFCQHKNKTTTQYIVSKKS